MAKKSLVAEAAAQAAETVPAKVEVSTNLDIFQTPAAPQEIVVPATSATTPYVVFAEPASQNNWATLQLHYPNIGPGDQVLMLPSPMKPMLLNPMRFYLVTHTQYWAEMDDANNLVAASFDKDSGLGERNECVVIVDTGTMCHAANLSCTSVKSACIHKAAQAGVVAASGDWGTISAEHAATLQIPDWRFRYVTSVRIVKRIGKASKRPYYAADATITPTTEAEYKRLRALFEDPKAQAIMANVRDTYIRRVETIRETVGG